MAVITQHAASDVDSLTRELCEKLKQRNTDIKAEFARNVETIAALERRLNLEPTQSSLSDMLATSPVENNSKGRPSNPAAAPAYKRNVFFGLTQKAAAIKLLKITGQPMKINDMLETLERSDYHFKAQNPYRILWKTLSEADEIQKQGGWFGLKEWRENGNVQISPYQMPADDVVDFRNSHDTPESGETPAKE